MVTIRKILRKSKGFLLGEAYIPLLIILVGLGSFGLGRLSSSEGQMPPIRIMGPETTLSAPDEITASAVGEVIASRSSDKYHFPWCSGAQRISDTNKITFESAAAARAAGYVPAANCKGLE